MKVALTFAVIFGAGFILISAAPNDLKATALDTNEISLPVSKKLYKKGVSAEFGGYRASAGLGGDASGGGLYASAGTPFGSNANAGLNGGLGANAAVGGGSSEYYAYSGQGGNGFFDRIFAIPINVLHSVNDYVKTKGNGANVGGPGAYAGVDGLGAGASIGGDSGISAKAGTGLRFGGASTSNSGASASSFSGVSANAGKSVGTTDVRADAGIQTKPDGHYDKVFNAHSCQKNLLSVSRFQSLL